MPRRRARDLLLHRPRLVSVGLGTWFWWESLVPSLMPRSALLQGAIGAVSFAVGWALGALLGQGWDRLWRRLGRRDPLAAAHPWPLVVVTVLAVAAAVVGSVLWVRWQDEQRRVVGLTDTVGLTDAGTLWVVTLLLVVVVVAVGRFVALVVLRIDEQLPDSWPLPVRGVVAVGLLGGTAVVVTSIALRVGLLPFVDATYARADAAADPGRLAPQTATVSGGPGSLVGWDSLGAEGRNFVGTTTSTDALRTFRPDSQPVAPIRVYVGLRDAPDPAARAALAVRELERTGAFDRRYLVVWTVTGTGWVDPVAASGMEFAAGGDSAIVAQQYSYLPSWISFLVDKDEAAQAGRALYEAVHARWSQLPPDRRPELVLFGESLGSFGSESTFASGDPAATLQAAAGAADSVLWVGPTHDNAVWTALQDSRAPGSPTWDPKVGDGSLRLVDHGQDLTGATPPRVLWVQHPSDPIGWWTWSTIWTPPGWMDGPVGDDVPQQPSWFPVVSFLQGTVDLVNGFSAAPGHGHNYNPDFAYAWAALVAPSSWTPADTARLAQTLVSVS